VAQTALDPLTGLPKGRQPQAAAPFSYSPGVAPEALASTLFGAPGDISAQTQTGGAGGLPGMPDFASLIANDPLFKQSQADMAAMNIQDEASRNAAINRAVIQFGATPDFGKAQQSLGLDLGAILNPETAGLASQNQFSTQAQLNKANTDGIRQIRRSLAARGGLQSGELGYQLNENQTRYGQAQNDATQKLLDYIGGVQSAYTSYQRQQEELQRQAALEAAQRAELLYQYQPQGGGGQAAGGATGGGGAGGFSDLTFPGPQQQDANLGGGVFPGSSTIVDALTRAAANPNTPQVVFGPPPPPNAYNTNKNKRG
jgi:hypothetical protein